MSVIFRRTVRIFKNFETSLSDTTQGCHLYKKCSNRKIYTNQVTTEYINLVKPYFFHVAIRMVKEGGN